MRDAPIDLVVARLNCIDENVNRISDDVREMKNRLSSLEAGQASIIQHLGHLAAADAQQQLTADRSLDRISRLEQRLDLRDA
jgi:uncharacterized coiled-coil protein SlyX